MTIELASIIPQDDELSPPLRKSTRGIRSVRRTSMSGFDASQYFDVFTGFYGLLTGAFVVFFLLIWVFLYSFNFGFTQHDEDSKLRGKVDGVRVFFWSLFISVLVALVAMLWFYQ